MIEGSMTLLLMTGDGIYAARDRYGRTPLVIGKKEDACCASCESHAYINLGYEDLKELGPGEIDFITPEGVKVLQKPGDKMRICSFLWVYYGYPTSTYEGVNVEEMRYKCGDILAGRDAGEVNPDLVAGVPDSVLPMPSAMPTVPGCLLHGRLSNILQPGPDLLCRPSRAREI